MVKKTNPTGVRFDTEQLDYVKKREKLESPQQVVNFLLKAYWDVWHVPKNPFNAPVPEPQMPEDISTKKNLKKGYDYFIKQMDSLDGSQDSCNYFVAEVNDSDLERNEKIKLKELLKNKTWH